MSVPRPWPRRRPLWHLVLMVASLLLALLTVGGAAVHHRLGGFTWVIGAVYLVNTVMWCWLWRRAVGEFDQETERLAAPPDVPPVGP